MRPYLPAAIAWIDRELPQFGIPVERASFEHSIWPIAELAQAGDLLIRGGRADLGRRWLDHAWQAVLAGTLLDDLVASSPAHVVYAFAYPPFYRHGYRHEGLESALPALARSPTVPPMHRLTIGTALEAIGKPSPWPVEALLQNDWARRLGVPWSLTADDLTTISHDLCFVTDHGRERGRIPAAQRALLEKWLPVWCGELAKQSALELVAEMLLAWHCVFEACAPDEVWSTFARHQAADGSLPSAVPDDRKLEFGEASPERQRFLRTYRGTVFAVMATTVCRHVAN